MYHLDAAVSCIARVRARGDIHLPPFSVALIPGRLHATYFNALPAAMFMRVQPAARTRGF
jgi:hypothetical protein